MSKLHTLLERRAVDALVAEMVFGFEVLESPKDRKCACHWGRYRKPGSHEWRMIEPYTVSWDAAGQVVTSMKDNGFTVSIMYPSATTFEWSVAFGDNEAVKADTFPLACSLAALDALGVAVDQPASTQTQVTASTTREEQG